VRSAAFDKLRQRRRFVIQPVTGNLVTRRPGSPTFKVRSAYALPSTPLRQRRRFGIQPASWPPGSLATHPNTVFPPFLFVSLLQINLRSFSNKSHIRPNVFSVPSGNDCKINAIHP
jgi:hypothetical protein